VPFELNTNDFHFDTEIIIQFLLSRLSIAELPIPTYYGDEICRVNGIKYARDVTKAVLVARTQQLGLLYDRRFDCAPAGGHSQYEPKLDYPSTHSAALEVVPAGARVLDLGCAGGYVGAMLRRQRHCRVTGVDKYPLGPGVAIDEFVLHDLNDGVPPLNAEDYDHVLLLDVIEHLTSPEAFVEQLRRALKATPGTRVIVSTANIGFLVNRLMLLFGQFNYGKRGILDLTHTRLFTFKSFRRLFEQGGFRVRAARGIPGPFPLALGNKTLSRLVMRINEWLIAAAPGLFSYQMFFVVEPLPSVEYLLDKAREHSAVRGETGERRAAGGRR
jgi:2-polyprenyl-3-methyl-5-hydroxy-6-metoxy-1,4-benzoquinol methylase